jgi:hypothetical protein
MCLLLLLLMCVATYLLCEHTHPLITYSSNDLPTHNWPLYGFQLARHVLAWLLYGVRVHAKLAEILTMANCEVADPHLVIIVFVFV